MLQKLYTWILPIRDMPIEDIGLFALLVWWDVYKPTYVAKMLKIAPAYNRFREALRLIHPDCEPWQYHKKQQMKS